MYSYTWDIETGGLLLNSSPLEFSKEPRPVYYKELDILGFDKHWNYEKDDTFPYMWAEAHNYWYRGVKVAKTKGGSLYTKPEIILLEEPEEENGRLKFVDIPLMVEKNKDLLNKLTNETITKVYNTFVEYKDKVDVFYVAFSGGKDSIVTLDIIQKALPHTEFLVLFGDTGMEFSDTYKTVDLIKKYCENSNIVFLESKSKIETLNSWKSFGPPSVTARWCCSVHKTSPQIIKLQEYIEKKNFVGMAFTGVRGDESASRSEYEQVNLGGKHQGQYSMHPLLDWNSAELYTYIYSQKLIINETYKKGNSRAGCLICPMSSGKHEFMKRQNYTNDVDAFVNLIYGTSGKDDFTKKEMVQFIDEGNWKTRKSGRELNIGIDKHLFEAKNKSYQITTFNNDQRWKKWLKTIGDIISLEDNSCKIMFENKIYEVLIKEENGRKIYNFPNSDARKQDIKFISLFKGVIVKGIYCNSCGVCIAECKNQCINMDNGLEISNECTSCNQCHNIYESCLRYNSIRNKIGGEKMAKGLDRYFTFGIRKEWLNIFLTEQGTAEFWDSDAGGLISNKKKDAFVNFVKDAGLVELNKSISGNKYSKNEPTNLAKKLFNYGIDSDITWGMILCNLAYTPQFNWFIKNINRNEVMTLDKLKLLLEDVMENDNRNIGKRNIADAFKILLIKTPFGEKLGLGICEFEEKQLKNGNDIIKLQSFIRKSWEFPEPIVILYALYKFAENCGDYYQFTLTRLLDHNIDSDGVSPTEIFGIQREQMEKILTGLSMNYPDFINASFTLGLDNITLRNEKTSNDVIELL